MSEQPQTVADVTEASAREYGKYVAKEVIFIDGGRAFNVGDPVPVGHVENGVVDKAQVSGANTKAAQAAKES